MISADTSSATSGNTQHHPTTTLRPLHQLLYDDARPQPARSSPTNKCGKTVLCPQISPDFPDFQISQET